MSLKDKVAVVTGSSNGIGAAVALQLADAGAKVVVNYTRSESDARRMLQLVTERGSEAMLGQGDISDDAACRRITEAALARWGRIDVLVNNAGATRFAAQADLAALDSEDFVNIYRVNVVGAYQMVRACAPAMRNAGGGSVVNVSSMAAVTGLGSSTAYAASKGALNTMSLSLARALAPDIRVNVVCPGFVATRWFADQFGPERFDQIKELQVASLPLARVCAPEDVAAAVMFFLGETAAHVTGEVLMVDGGYHLGPAATARR